MNPVFKKARESYSKIRAMPLKERIEHIRSLKRVILKERDWILDQIQEETRKTRTDAFASEIFGVLDHLSFLEKYSRKHLLPRSAPTPLTLMGKKSEVWFEPLGTVLVISPWNYPFFQAVVPSTLSFICGNATIFKPSEHTPLKGLLEHLFQLAKWDPDWIQVVYGDGRVAQELIDQKPEKIFFTGSTRTGKAIMTQAAQHLIPVELELGGKDAMIVFDDVDLDRATSGALWGAMTNTGQSCTSVERLLVQRSIYPKFLEILKEKSRSLTQGVDHEGDRDLGLMTTDFQAEIVRKQLSEVGVKAEEIRPTIIAPANEASTVWNEETFGPVLPVIAFDTEEEAIKKANASIYGLSASVWSRDLVRARRVAGKLEVGCVSINNVMLTEGNSALPFGGVKQSGLGRYRGEFGFYSFSNIKAVLIDKDSSKIEAHWYPFTLEKYRLFSKMAVAWFSGGVISLFQFIYYGLKLENLSQRLVRKVK